MAGYLQEVAACAAFSSPIAPDSPLTEADLLALSTEAAPSAPLLEGPEYSSHYDKHAAGHATTEAVQNTNDDVIDNDDDDAMMEDGDVAQVESLGILEVTEPHDSIHAAEQDPLDIESGVASIDALTAGLSSLEVATNSTPAPAAAGAPAATLLSPELQALAKTPATVRPPASMATRSTAAKSKVKSARFEVPEQGDKPQRKTPAAGFGHNPTGHTPLVGGGSPGHTPWPVKPKARSPAEAVPFPAQVPNKTTSTKLSATGPAKSAVAARPGVLAKALKAAAVNDGSSPTAAGKVTGEDAVTKQALKSAKIDQYGQKLQQVRKATATASAAAATSSVGSTPPPTTAMSRAKAASPGYAATAAIKSTATAGNSIYVASRLMEPTASFKAKARKPSVGPTASSLLPAVVSEAAAVRPRLASKVVMPSPEPADTSMRQLKKTIKDQLTAKAKKTVEQEKARQAKKVSNLSARCDCDETAELLIAWWIACGFVSDVRASLRHLFAHV